MVKVIGTDIMVKDESYFISRFTCDVCKKPYKTIEQAKECERTKPTKLSFKDTFQEWNVGDIVIIDVLNRPVTLGVITGERLINHEIYPEVLCDSVGEITVTFADMLNFISAKKVEYLLKYSKDIIKQ